MPDELIPPVGLQFPAGAAPPSPPPFAYDASMLGYAIPLRGRPGMITAIGVLSIVLGSLGIVYHGLSMLQSAVFATFSTRSSSVSMSVTAGAAGSSSGSTPSTNSSAASSGLTPADVAAAIAAAQGMCNNRLTSAQVAALQAQLQAPGQQILTPPSQGLAPAAQVTSVQILPDGSASVAFYNGTVTIDAKGKSVNTMMLTSTAFAGFNIGKGTLLLWTGTSLLLIGVAAYLLFIGILTLRQSRKGRKLHYVYVLIKIPLTIACGLGYGFVMAQMMQGTAGPAAPPTTPSPTDIALLMGAFWGLLGCIYPVGLLFALRSRTVRDYYAVTTSP